MTVNATKTSLSTSSNTLTLEEGTYNIQLKSGQSINTNKFVTGGTYVFKKGTRIPFCYLVARRTSGSSCTFTVDLTNGNVANIVNGTAESYKPGYFSQLTSAITSYNLTPTYYIGAAESSLSPTSSSATTEKNYFASIKAFDKSAYSNSYRAPVIRVSNDQIPNSNIYVRATLSSNQLYFTITSSYYSFISLVLVL